MTRDRDFYRSFFAIFFPLVLQNIITLGVNLADNIMLGRYGEAALSGVTAANQIQFLYQQVINGICDGLVIIGSQYWGRKDTGPIRKVSAVAMRFALAAMLILFAAASLFPSQLIGAFSSDAAIIAEGTDYLSIIRFTYIFFCLTMVLTAVLRSTEVVRIALWLSLTALVINVGLNWVFIFGNLGFPAMGTKGAAIATLISRIAEFTLLLLYIRCSGKCLKLRLRDFLGIDREILSDYFRVSLPLILVAGLWGLNIAMQTAILGHLSSSAIAANSMASNLFLLTKTAAVGAAATTNVLIGKAIGSGGAANLKSYSRTLQIMFLAIGLFSGAVLYLCTEPVLSLYSFSAESASLARQFLHILVFVEIGMSYQMPVTSGIIKGGGDTAYLMKINLISTWGIVVPLSFFLAFVVKASPAAVVICLNSDQIFKCVPAFLKVNFGNWTKKLTRG